MLFGVKLQNEIYGPWANYYIDYDGLKKLLKENVLNYMDSSNGPWSEKDESHFAEVLDSELEKVYSFQVSKYKELDSEISKLELQSEKFLESLETGGKDLQFNSIEFQKKLEELLSLTNELDHFARLNFTGFVKIVKKHDRLHQGYSVKALLAVRMKDLPLNNISEDTSPYLFRISTLYSFIREQLNTNALSTSLKESFSKLSTSGKLSSTPNANLSTDISENTYKVLKFWVHPDNLMEIKTTILRHLPVLVYNSNPNDVDEDVDEDEYLSDPTITSLYFDNRNFELYNNKLLKQLNKTPSIRIKWTGKLKNNPELTLEEKIFDYDTGKSDDIRLQLKEKYINDFIFAKNQNKDEDLDHLNQNDDEYEPQLVHFKSAKPKKPFNLQTYTKRLEKRGFDKAAVDKYAHDFEKLQDAIVRNDLQPTLRTVFTRTAFQMPGDDRIRIGIDSDILFIREDSFDSKRPIRNPGEWHRKDIDSNINNPYSLLRKGEFSKFPYSVMEIKIASSIFNNPRSKTLAWVNELISSHLVKEVPNFSKFIQGISSLFIEDDNLDILPFWLPELDHDIRKNPEQAYKDSKNKQIKEQQQAEVLKNLKKKIGQSVKPITETGNTKLDSILEGDDLDIGSSDEEDSIPSLPTEQMRLLPQGTTPASNRSGIQDTIAQRRKRKNNIADLLMPVFAKSSKLDGYESEDEEIELPPGVVKPTQLIRQSGPVKVEAKVWLANERTFVRWLHVTTLLTALTFTIYSSVKSSHFPRMATDLAYIYFALTIFSAVWAFSIYHRRLELIKARSGQHLDGMLGPLILALILVVTLILEFYVGLKKWNEKSNAVLSLVAGEVNVNINNMHPWTQWTLSKLFSIVEN